MNQRRLRWGLCAVHGNVPHFDLHVERNNMEAADFRAATGDPLYFSDHATAHIGLKRIGIDIPEARDQEDDAGPTQNQHILPPASRPAAGSVTATPVHPWKRFPRQEHSPCFPSAGIATRKPSTH